MKVTFGYVDLLIEIKGYIRFVLEERHHLLTVRLYRIITVIEFIKDVQESLSFFREWSYVYRFYLFDVEHLVEEAFTVCLLSENFEGLIVKLLDFLLFDVSSSVHIEL